MVPVPTQVTAHNKPLAPCLIDMIHLYLGVWKTHRSRAFEHYCG
jgi:hypothetical protein